MRTIEELHAYVTNPVVAISKREAEGVIAQLEEAFAGWDEDAVAALVLNLGCLLGLRRGPEGIGNLERALVALYSVLEGALEARRNLN